MGKSRAFLGLLTAGLLLEAGFLVLAGIGRPAAHFPLFFGVYTLQFLLVAWLFFGIAKAEKPLTRGERSLIAGFAILFRITLGVTTPALSDDIYRYGWEGRVQRAGLNPYYHPPSAPELSFLRGPTYELLNHKNISAVYPPLTEGAFFLASYLSDVIAHWATPLQAEVWGQKLIFVFFDLASALMLAGLLKQRGFSQGRVILYAWNPLVVLEFAGSGHNDALGIFYLLAGLHLWNQRRYLSAATGWVFSFLSKYLAILLVPYLYWRGKKKEAGVLLVFSVAGIVAFSGWTVAPGLQRVLTTWQFNGSVYAFLQACVGNPDIARWGVMAMLGILTLWIGKKEENAIRAAYLLVMSFLLLAPTVHPWYFIWLIPFLCFFPNPALLFWNLSVILSYTVFRRLALYHVWDLHPAVVWLEYGPVYGLLAWQALRNRHESFDHHPRTE